MKYRFNRLLSLIAKFTTLGMIVSSPVYAGEIPKYHYETKNNAQEEENPKAPINVIWQSGNAEIIAKKMKRKCGWKGPIPFGDSPRYINVGGRIIKTSKHVTKSIGLPAKQYHVRLYNYDGHGNYKVVGQVHRDPAFHNQPGKWLPGIGKKSWKFNKARKRVLNCWNKMNIPYEFLEVGNDFKSHDGKVLVIKNGIKTEMLNPNLLSPKIRNTTPMNVYLLQQTTSFLNQ